MEKFLSWSSSRDWRLFQQAVPFLNPANEKEKLRFAFKVYDRDEDGYISNGDLFAVLKMMVGTNLNDVQLQQLVDRTIIKADKDFDGLISFEEFCEVFKDPDIASKLTLNYK